MVQSVKGTVASTNSKKRKANDYRQEAFESADIDEKAPSEPDARLTKQQKRDIRRAIIAADDQKVANKVPSASDSAEVRRMNKIMKRRARNVRPETIPPTPIPVNATSAPEARLTKQQKRDKRRAVIAAGERKAAGTVTTTSDYAADVKEINTSSVYRRVPILPPPSPFPLLNVDRFLVPGDKNFQKVLDTCYDGFVMDKPEEYSDEFHESFETSFTEIEKSGVFQFDLTQPAGLGTKVAKTFVTRCLVGEPGITYKYLGLRMFSYPWDGSDKCTSFATIGRLNKIMADRTAVLLKQSKRSEVGSCRFNLTLINKCYPINGEVKMKLEPTFQKEKCTVSWHADSTLEHYSSIAVYHCTKAPKTKKNPEPAVEKTTDDSWRISLRVSPHAEGPKAAKIKSAVEVEEDEEENNAPPLAVPLPNKYSYYLLDDFNHHHQHSVLAGKTDRYASTHRVSRTDGHTFQSIKNKCVNALQGSGGASAKQVRTEQLALNELEFEWLRQFYIQGTTHYNLHTWWHGPLKDLMDLWSKLESRTKILLQALQDASEGMGKAEINAKKLDDNIVMDNRTKKLLAKRKKRASVVTSGSYEAAIEGLTEVDPVPDNDMDEVVHISYFTNLLKLQRMSKREGWYARTLDPAFQTVPTDCQPMPVPFPVYSTFQASSEKSNSESTLDEAAIPSIVTLSHREPEILMTSIDILKEQYNAFLSLN